MSVETLYLLVACVLVALSSTYINIKAKDWFLKLLTFWACNISLAFGLIVLLISFVKGIENVF